MACLNLDLFHSFGLRLRAYSIWRLQLSMKGGLEDIKADLEVGKCCDPVVSSGSNWKMQAQLQSWKRFGTTSNTEDWKSIGLQF